LQCSGPAAVQSEFTRIEFYITANEFVHCRRQQTTKNKQTKINETRRDKSKIKQNKIEIVQKKDEKKTKERLAHLVVPAKYNNERKRKY
jgi:uncharacterized membrane protein YhiD involved in acid resistance